MDYLKPADVVRTMVEAGVTKGALPAKDILIRGALSGALLGVATAFSYFAIVQTNLPLVGALVFPVGFCAIVLLGLELATGSFALLPVAAGAGRVSTPTVLGNWGWVLLGNLLGSLCFAGLLWAALTDCGQGADASGLAAKIVAAAQAKTLGYAKFGAAGFVTAFVKGMLCNWLVCLGVVLPMTSSSTGGKILAAWLPIFTFVALGFEHSIVNMFVIPAAMLLGAKLTLVDWLFWNQLPVTLGNVVGGMLFTGLALFYTYGKAAVAAPRTAAVTEKIREQPDLAR